ncbi:MBL fold metallo-hydrolase [Paenibacillus filicis]|uniref:MBL fold metallo-hydrolase n=1 Tax=Paenibacillus gyeongsangnamensis TaxID=3388067 RepID=A0ABT4QB88_9BACL|nr:MBL fold metallo-hydrolase [Paenibacillus filicis]MCZ8514093.1 MBL fold metallo-hydrolase [Paenibacillus filicis]
MPRQRFENLGGVRNTKTLRDVRKWRRQKKAKIKDYSYKVPYCENRQLELLRGNRTETTVTWIGHSSFLVQIAGINLLLDPVWAERMGLDKRMTEPGIHLAELPRIDAVLLSHSHYDHMDLSSLKRLLRLNHHLQLFVPEGLGTKLMTSGFHRVTELSWWGRVRLVGMELHFVPAQHWTRRTLTDANRSHWGGWVLKPYEGEGCGKAIYFAGDSGYFPGFKMIGDRFDIGIALLPIGAYEPEWFMHMQHMTPEEAVQSFIDCRAEHFVPMHYGAYKLSNDTPLEALNRLKSEWKRRGLATERLHLLKLGETMPGQTLHNKEENADA